MSSAEDFGSFEDFESEEIGVTLKTWQSFKDMKREDFCFRSFIFSFLSHRKHRTVKGGRGNSKEKISMGCSQLTSVSFSLEAANQLVVVGGGYL